MRQYELTYLISDVVPESDLNKITGKIGGYISAIKGSIEKEEIWGRRKLAYPIKKQEFATYVTINFSVAPEFTAELEREIRLTNEVLRHLLIVKEYEKEELTLTADEIAENSAVQEVVGSEKSFEAIEGETEASKNLMAVREEVEEKTEEKAPATKEVVAEVEKTAVIETPAVDEKKAIKEKKDAEKETVKKVAKVAKVKKGEDEADRLSKLNDELDDILKDDL
ncbi:MAG: 30S ribosomal protein S6 [bacterium]